MSENNRPSRSMWTPGRDTRTGGCTPTDIKEEQLLFQALSPCVRRICVFIANAGLRFTEAITLQQHQFFDFKYGSKGNRLTVEVVGLDPKDTKGNYERIIPLNSDAVKAKNEALEYNGELLRKFMKLN